MPKVSYSVLNFSKLFVVCPLNCVKFIYFKANFPYVCLKVTVWDEDFSSGLECGGVNSFKIDDDGEVTDFENNDNENTFDFIFNFLPELSDTVLHQWINVCLLARQGFWPVNNLLVVNFYIVTS